MDQTGVDFLKWSWSQAAFCGILLVLLAFGWWMERKERIKAQEDLRVQDKAFAAAKDAIHDKQIELLRATIDSDNKVTTTLERLTEQQRNNANALEMLRSTLLMRGREVG